MKLVGIIGKKSSGKDTFFHLAFEYLSMAREAFSLEEPMRLAFGDALKLEVSRATGMGIESINHDKAAFRKMLQWWGTEFRRGMFGNDYWLRRLRESHEWRYHEKMRSHPGLNFITDIRFINEARLVRDDGGILIRITRGGCELRDTHASETELDQIVADYEIWNDGTIGGLAAEVSNLLPKLLKPEVASCKKY